MTQMKLRKQLLAAFFALFAAFGVAACETGPATDDPGFDPGPGLDDPTMDDPMLDDPATTPAP
jgi:hypothetical protein